MKYRIRANQSLRQDIHGDVTVCDLLTALGWRSGRRKLGSGENLHSSARTRDGETK